MTHHSTTRGHLRYVLTILFLLSLLVLGLRPACAGDEGQAQQDQPPEVKEQQGTPSDHYHDPGHNHGKDGGELRAAPPKNNLSPEQLAHLAKLKKEALEKAEKIYRSMKLDPALTSLKLGFDHNGQLYGMGMTLEQALIKVLTGGNRCRIKSSSDGTSDYQLDIITMDKRLMSLQMKPNGDKLLIQSMTLTKLEGEGGIKESGAKAAFYLMAFLQSR